MDTTTLHMPEPHHTEGADGRAHLTYYDRERALSFTWTGMPGHPIEVCAGGAGEPIRWRITVNGLDFEREYAKVAADASLDPAYLSHLPATYLAPHLFQGVCDRWITEAYDDDDHPMHDTPAEARDRWLAGRTA